MTTRDTRTGSVLETMILPALDRGGYSYEKQAFIGVRLGGGQHKVDVLAVTEAGDKFLISLKWQQTSDTAEQKVPFEVICLVDAVKSSAGVFNRAYLVLGGDGWKLREFYVNDLERYIPHQDYVTITKLEAFIAKANKGRL